MRHHEHTVKLNLGCGDDIREGYVNVDFRATGAAVQIEDLSRFPWTFVDNSAAEILMLDFLEHFPYRMTTHILLECYRVLRPGGELVIQVPDTMHIARALCREGTYLCNRCGQRMYGQDTGEYLDRCPGCGQHVQEISEAAMMRLFGGQDYVGNDHRTCFTQQTLYEKAFACGFTSAKMEEIEHQFKNWNLKMRLTKGDIW